jgi:hypothetical protein
MVHGLGHELQVVFMIRYQKRRQQRKSTMFWFYGTFPSALKTNQREMAIADMIEIYLPAIIIANPLGAVPAAAQRTL